jgi:hypothetical protein
VSRVESFDLCVVELGLLVDLDRVKVCDSVTVKSMVDVSGLIGGLFGSFVAESGCVVCVGVGD